jgi:hypothetical protein
MKSKLLVVFLSVISQFSLASEPAKQFDAAVYEKTISSKAVVLISANWSRKWNCGRYENAELQFLSFDKSGLQKEFSEKADLIVQDESLLPALNTYVNYAFILDPGEYQLFGFRIKLGRSLSSTQAFFGDRKNLAGRDGKSKAGSFTVGAGEVVYIGHFGLDCATAPMPWRYYPETKEDFAKYLDGIKQQFPGLPVQKVVFRLFDTSIMGTPFTMP